MVNWGPKFNNIDEINVELKVIQQTRETTNYFLDKSNNWINIEENSVYKFDFNDIRIIIECFVEGLDIFEHHLNQELNKWTNSEDSFEILSPQVVFSNVETNKQKEETKDINDIFIRNSYNEKLDTLFDYEKKFIQKIEKERLEVNYELWNYEYEKTNLPDDFYEHIITWNDFFKKLSLVKQKYSTIIYNLNNRFRLDPKYR